jgi:hypothetical protein
MNIKKIKENKIFIKFIGYFKFFTNNVFLLPILISGFVIICMVCSVSLENLNILILLCTAIILFYQTIILRNQFFSMYRPKLIVHRLSFNGGSAGESKVTPCQIQYVITNVGGCGAEIVEGRVKVMCFKGEVLPMPPIYSDTGINETVIENRVLGISEPYEKDIILSDNPCHVCGDDFYFLGYIVYKDSLGKNYYRTAFCRKYDIKNKRFNKVEDTEYEYEY